jgi:ribosomal-protein-alanine N-acetyltransferase
MQVSAYLNRLTDEDISFLQELEKDTNLTFWGCENYKKLLAEDQVYFGFKALAIVNQAGKDRPVGFYLARSLCENLEILKIGVAPECQRKGIGTILMESAYAEGIKRGCSRCFLEVRRSNMQAISFYQKHRFKISGTRLNYYKDPVEDAWIMERNL